MAAVDTFTRRPAAQGESITASHRAGVFHDVGIELLVAEGNLRAAVPLEERQIQPASIDLRLGPIAYQVRASFLPSKTSSVLDDVKELQTQEIDLTSSAVLERGCVYIVPLVEELRLAPDVGAKANPKSSTGRIDVLTRLITDYAAEFERVPHGYHGRLYVEIAPRTFSVVVRAGSRLNQLRFVRGNPPYSDHGLLELHQAETLVSTDEGPPTPPMIANGLWISVDLKGNGDGDVVGYRAKRYAPPIDVDAVGAYDPEEFWEEIARPSKRQIILGPGEFYILASKERIRIPPNVAAEMVGYDPSVGEFRIHYAGFFDPGFGYGDGDTKGTRAVLEVRSHEVPFLVKDGQRVGRFIYERLLGEPRRLYGAGIGSSYGRQRLALAKQFRPRSGC